MAIEWADVSIPLKPGMTVWPGDTPFSFEPESRMSQGDSCNVSRITLSSHTGTHCDAPWHFEDSGKKLDEIDPQVFFGDARLIDVGPAPAITAKSLGRSPLPPRILLKSSNSEYPVNGPFLESYAGIEPDAAQRMVDEGVKLAGVDYLSVAPYKQPDQATHHILLRNGVFVVEGLCLAGFTAGDYPFVVLPMPIEGADGAPCRAFIGRER